MHTSARFSIKSALVASAFALGVSAIGLSATADESFAIEPIGMNEIVGDLIHNPSTIKWDPIGKNKRAKVVESEGVPGGMAIQIEAKRKSKDAWDIRLRAPVEKDIASGDTLATYFWLRAAKLPKGAEAGKVDVVVQRKVDPYDQVILEEIQPTEEWKMYKVTGTAGADFPVDDTEMGFNLAKMKQTIEFGPFYTVRVATE